MAHIWNNLKTHKCPRCKCVLVLLEEVGIFECGNPSCTFKISEIKLLQILGKMHESVKAKMFYHDEEENLEELNKL